MSDPVQPSDDYGEVVTRARIRVSWAWLFPLMAAIAAGWMFYSNWNSEGPDIQIEFATAPGIHAGKTELIFRGLVAGMVTKVELSPNLEKAVITVRLKSFASDLARDGTTFWIDQPVISLSQASGIQSLIEGNSIQARMGYGKSTRYFVGSSNIPIDPLENPTLVIRVKGSSIPYLDWGSEVTFHGVVIGNVKKKGLDEKMQPYVDIGISNEYASKVCQNARFWIIPPASAKIGPGFFKIQISSLKQFVLGGVAIDYFSDPGEPVKTGAEFWLSPNENSARAVSDPIELVLTDAQGILPGETQLRYKGFPVGLVENVIPRDGKVIVTARFHQGYDFIRSKGAVFSVVRPSLELQKITGLETLVSGIYIDCLPGEKGTVADRFHGTSREVAEMISSADSGFQVFLQAPSCKIAIGSTILYRGVKVGTISAKSLSKDGRMVTMTASINPQYAPLLRQNTRFWNASGVQISGGLISLNVQTSAMESRILGVIQFATPDGNAMGERVEEGHVYELSDAPRKEWLKWAPAIPLGK